MLKGKISNASILVRVLVWLGIMGVLTMVAFGVWFFLPNRDGLVGMKWLQLLQSVATFLLPALAGAYLWSNTPMQWLHLDSKPSWQEALAAVVVMLLAIPGINLLSAWNQQMVLPEWMSGIEQCGGATDGAVFASGYGRRVAGEYRLDGIAACSGGGIDFPRSGARDVHAQ